MIYQKYLVKGEDHFDPERYPDLISEMASVDSSMSTFPAKHKAEMLLSYLRKERISNTHEVENPGLASLLSSNTLPLENALSLFAASGSNRMFRNELEEFIRSSLNGTDR